MHNASFWETNSFLKRYDLIIVGAGITGLSSAYFFKKAHPEATILVLEKGFIPQGASTRNAGFACIGSVTEHLADLENESEKKVKERILKRYQGLKLLKETLGENAIGYEPCGGYELFTNETTFNEAAVEIDRFNEWLFELTGEKSVYATSEYEGYPVITNRLEGALHPGKMMRALMKKATETGVNIKWNSAVNEANKDGDVILENGLKLRTRKMIIATNGFIKRLLPDILVNPARGLVFVTNELPNLKWQGIFHHDRGYIYFRNVANRFLIGGARNSDIETEETDQFGINEKIKKGLVEFVNETIKLPDSWKIEQEWSGIMGFTPTKTPIVKQIDERRYVAAGLSGMGIAIGMEIGREAAGQVARRIMNKELRISK